MSIVTEEICRAFEERRRLRLSNSETDGTSLWLFGNMIARWVDDEIYISNAGWRSKTTKERLNGLTGVSIVQRAGSWYINGNYWDGEWTSVSENNGIRATMQTEAPQEDEFDITSEWVKSKGYNKPVYAVYRADSSGDAYLQGAKLTASNVKFRMVETDTAGEYKPNFFLVVMPEDIELAKSLLINQI